jgi:acetyl-CoA carboxylase biotin carboxyl carrier protein
MDLQVIEQLIRMVNTSAITCLEIEEQGVRIRLEKQMLSPGGAPGSGILSGISNPMLTSSATPLLFTETAQAAQMGQTAQAAQSAQQNQPSQAPQTQESAHSEPEEGFVYIKSPLVGTYHSTQALGYDPVELGDTVEPGQAVCAVEAMKLMNVIEAEVVGQIVEFMVEEGALVEYGQNLVKMRQP